MKIVVSVYKDDGTQIFKKIKRRTGDGSDIPLVMNDVEEFLYDSQSQIDGEEA